MKFEITTRINKPLREEMKGMTQEMLSELNPKFPPFHFLRFDGIYKGAEIHIELNLFLKKEKWEYVIEEVADAPDSWSFVDVSKKQPFFIKSWRHRYTIGGSDSYTEITDSLEFHSPLFLEWMLYPWLYAHFRYRKPVYRKIFGKK
jgi:ligand-binding SRPBCC domain-containing protein